MQLISFNDRNAATGMGSMIIFLFIYFVQVVFALHLLIFILITGNKFIKINLQKNILKGIFFNQIISLTIEGLLEFIIYGFLNIYTKDFSMNGEIMGFCIGIFCLICVILVIITLIWALLTKNYS